MTLDPVHFPLGDALGLRLGDIERGSGAATAWLEVTSQHLNPHGVVHGAVPYLLLDTAMGAATMSVLPPEQRCTTVDIRVAYLAPCLNGTMTANASVRRAGRRLVFLDATVSGSDGTEFVTASGVFAVLRSDTTS